MRAPMKSPAGAACFKNCSAGAWSVSYTHLGENIWTFKTWKLDGVEVAPNTQVDMVSGGLHFEGIWETKLIHYSLTIQYVDKKGKELAESHMDLLSKGEAYKVDSPKIKGYKLKDKDKAVIEGTMPGRNLTIEVVYIKKSTGGGSGTIDSPNKPTTKAPALTLNTCLLYTSRCV